MRRVGILFFTQDGNITGALNEGNLAEVPATNEFYSYVEYVDCQRYHLIKNILYPLTFFISNTHHYHFENLQKIASRSFKYYFGARIGSF